MASSSSSSRDWVYDVFTSFSGEDVRQSFLSHFLKELDRKLITAFKVNEMERSYSLPNLKQAMNESKIAVVVFSENYASSSWCLNELLEIVKCKAEFGQMVIPVFYRVDPSHVRKQTGDFGKIFEETCKNTTEEGVIIRWRRALTDVADMVGYHSQNWSNEAAMIEQIVCHILNKLSLTPSKDFEEFVGIEDHIAEISLLLDLESEELRMVGIWGPSGVGKTTIARALFSRLSPYFRGSVYIDRRFVSKSQEILSRANPNDYKMKLHLEQKILSEISGKKNLKINHLDAVKETLKHQKVLIFIDDLDDQLVLDTLAGQTQWFGSGSRIIVVTNDKHLLRAHGIDLIYEVCLPSEGLALEMFCQSAFMQNYPPDSFREIVSDVVLCAGSLPLGLNFFGSYLRGMDKESWVDMMPKLRNGLDGEIWKALRVNYDSLNNRRDEALFRYITRLFNGEKVEDIKELLADSHLDVSIGLKNLVDKSQILVRLGTVEMHCLLEEMGRKIVRAQTNEPGEREFLVELELKDSCKLLEDNIGTKKVLGISSYMDENYELGIQKEAFQVMPNLRFLKIYNTMKWDQKKEVRWHLPEGFDHFPSKLRLLRWTLDPVKSLPSNFNSEYLVKLQMPGSKLEKLWEGVQSLAGLREMDLQRSINLEEIPNLSMATNLETLDLSFCSSLVKLTSSIQCLDKLAKLNMSFCEKLETLPVGINLLSLDRLDLKGCSRLRSFPDISTNISRLCMNRTAIEVVPPWIKNFSKLEYLSMTECKNLQRVSINVSKLKHLEEVDFSWCRKLTQVSWNDSPSELAMTSDNIHSKLLVPHEASSSCPDNYVPKVKFKLTNCFNLDQEALYQQQSIFFKSMELSGEELPSYFTHRSTGTSLTNISLLYTSPSPSFFKFRACAVLDSEPISNNFISFNIMACCRFKDKLGNYFDLADWKLYFSTARLDSHLVIFDCCFPLNEDNTLLADHNDHQVDIQFHLTSDYSQLKLKGCGIQLLEDSLPLVCEGDKSKEINLEIYETESGKECGDIAVEMPSSRKWEYDVFLSFSGADVRVPYLSFLLKKLHRKFNIAFKDHGIKKSPLLVPDLKQVIKDPRVSVVVVSKNYASSSRCLNELVEILKCKEECGQILIPVFYGLDRSDVRKQTGDFGKVFKETCHNKTEEVKIRWREALTSVANVIGYYSLDWGNEVTIFEAIVNEVQKLLFTPSKNQTPSMELIEMSDDHDTYNSRPKELNEADGETDAIERDEKSHVNAKEADSIHGEESSDATSNSQNSIENKIVDPVKENKHEKVSEISTMVTYE